MIDSPPGSPRLAATSNFIRAAIDEDLRLEKYIDRFTDQGETPPPMGT